MRRGAEGIRRTQRLDRARARAHPGAKAVCQTTPADDMRRTCLLRASIGVECSSGVLWDIRLPVIGDGWMDLKLASDLR